MRYVVAFHTTTDAMHMQMAADEAGLPGRLITKPQRLSADCGLAWCSDPADRGKAEELLKEKRIPAASCCELLL